MRVLGASAVESVLETEPLIERLRQMFRSGVEAPPRHQHEIPVPGSDLATMLIMPAWQVGRYLGVKVTTLFPGNNTAEQPMLQGTYLLMAGRTGEPLAAIDAHMLTKRRTAAASALAAKYLARPDAHRLVMIGTGALAPQLIIAHATVRPITDVVIWGRHFEKAERLAQTLTNRYMKVTATRDLEAAVRGADIVSSATPATEPLLHGDWLKAGQHIDLVGSYKPGMRESDDTVIDRSRVYVDTMQALEESGDIVQPLKSGLITEKHIAGDLAELTQGRCHGRSFYNQITLFKSVGTALEDLAAAIMVFERSQGSEERVTLR
jgi:alanine dehydrogenase